MNLMLAGRIFLQRKKEQAILLKRQHRTGTGFPVLFVISFAFGLSSRCHLYHRVNDQSQLPPNFLRKFLKHCHHRCYTRQVYFLALFVLIKAACHYHYGYDSSAQLRCLWWRCNRTVFAVVPMSVLSH